METKEENKSNRKVILRMAICFLILLVGLIGMKVLASLKKPPAELSGTLISILFKRIVPARGFLYSLNQRIILHYS